MVTKRKIATSRTSSAGAATIAANLTSLWRRHEGERVAADAIYATLREAIVTNVLPAGERLGELQLAALFNRSRTPIREAIFRLESEHLAERSPRRGFVVGGISREEILEVYAVREVIDGLAARLAAQACLSSELDHLSWLNRRLGKAGEQRDYRLMVDLNIEFHETIARASRNGLLLQFMRQIHDWVRRFNGTTLSQRGRSVEALKEHDALLDAIRRRDPAAAEKIARAHMARAAEIRVAMLQSPPGDA